MRAGLPDREPGWLARWERLGVYARLRASAAGRPAFVLADGPPYANANLHIGHALDKVLKDFIVRSRQMISHDSRYVPGWDCHGLPIRVDDRGAVPRHAARNKDEVDVNLFRASAASSPNTGSASSARSSSASASPATGSPYLHHGLPRRGGDRGRVHEVRR